MFTKDHYIHVYTRKQAIADGVLKDVSSVAAEVGFREPVAMTAAAYAKYVEELSANISSKYKEAWPSCFLSMLFVAALEHRGRAGCHVYRWACQHASNGSTRRSVVVKVVRGPDDDGDPCLTVMCEDED